MVQSVDWHSLPRCKFGDGPELADELLALVLSGQKRATCWSAAEGSQDAVVGGRWVVEDGQGRPRAILETTELFTKQFDHIDEDFAAAEGEGDLTLTFWRAAHQTFFRNNGGFHDKMLLWCERFVLVEILPMAD